MASSARPRLTIPAVLTVSALGLSLGCPAGDDGDTGNDTGTQTGPGTSTTTEGPGTTQGETEATSSQTTAATTTDTTAATGLDTSSTAATGLDTGATTGEPEPLPDCASYLDEATCNAEMLCRWDFKRVCVLYCEMIDDQQTCESTDSFCAWFEGEGCVSPI